MKTIDYDKEYEENTGGTETHVATDDRMNMEGVDQHIKMVEGFASANGVRPETAASGGRIEHPEMQDASHPDRVVDSIEKENPGTADE